MKIAIKAAVTAIEAESVTPYGYPRSEPANGARPPRQLPFADGVGSSADGGPRFVVAPVASVGPVAAAWASS